MLGEKHEDNENGDNARGSWPPLPESLGNIALKDVPEPKDGDGGSRQGSKANGYPHAEHRHGKRKRFRYENGEFSRDSAGELVEDPDGKPYRQWREKIRNEGDIWNEIERAA